MNEEEKHFIIFGDIDKVNSFLFKISQETPKKIIDYSLLYLERGKNNNNNNIKYVSYYYLHRYYHYILTKFEIATYYADSTLTQAKKIGNPKKIIRALNLKGSSKFELGNYQEAYKSYSKAHKLSKKSKLYAEEIYSIAHIGHVKKVLKQYDEGVEIYNEVLKLLKTEKYKKIDSYYGSYFNAINVLGICHRELGNNEKAIEFFIEGLSKIDEIGVESFKRNRAMLLTNMGKAYINQGDYDTALNHLYLAKSFFLEQNKSVNNVYFHTYKFIAEALEKKNNHEQALAVLEEAILLAEKKEILYSEILIKICDAATLLGEKLSDTNKTLKYSRLRNKISDSIHTENVQTRKLINKELSEENKALYSDNKSKSEKLDKTNIITTILLCTLIVTILIYLYNYFNNRKKFKILLDKVNKNEKDRISSPIISDEKANKILTHLEKLEKKSFFLDKNCSLHNTATKLKTNTSYLSKIINSHKSKTFKEYINELRIEFVLSQIKENPHFRLYTIKAIAEETGYKSVNTLNQTFKKHTQLSLSYYIKQFNKVS